jgi:hypothetical protein
LVDAGFKVSALVIGIAVIASGIALFGVALWLLVFSFEYKELKESSATSAQVIRELRRRVMELEGN